jgi:outer membrane protein assembly factor BamB
LLCLDAATGKELWRFDDCDAVFSQPTNAEHVLFGSRDGGCYCLDQRIGHVVWRADVGGPVTARVTQANDVIYCASENGRIHSFDVADGRSRWVFDLTARTGMRARVLAAPAVSSDRSASGRRRLVYVGTELSNPVSSAAVLYCLQD